MIHLARANAERIPLADKSCDLVIGSPPYVDARLYLEDGQDLKISRNAHDWVEWMLRVTEEALRVSKGAVIWVCAGVTRDRTYWPACEGLAWEWFKRGGSAYRPVYWHRNGIPGSGGDQWFRADVEYCLCFKRSGPLPWTDNMINAHKSRWQSGGCASYRQVDGSRIPNGKRILPDMANPGTLLSTGAAGGGRMGHDLAHESEGPYPVKVPAWFISSLCHPNGLVCDPFSGSGSTGQAAMETNRRYIGFDLRQSQCRLARRRLRTVTPGLPFGVEV